MLGWKSWPNKALHMDGLSPAGERERYAGNPTGGQLADK